MFRKFTIISVLCLLTCLPAQARPSVRYHAPARTNYVYINHDSHDDFARNVAITAAVVAVVALIVAVDNKPRTTGDAGYDRFLEQRKWQGRN